mmetsp:Transcript_53084/g.153082  ORF Transcript_53084/g.153082 Transcript_53084/m.153082 type:complete len:222 (+) Transcript_53084:1510-2175(+)
MASSPSATTCVARPRAATDSSRPCNTRCHLRLCRGARNHRRRGLGRRMYPQVVRGAPHRRHGFGARPRLPQLGFADRRYIGLCRRSPRPRRPRLVSCCWHRRRITPRVLAPPLPGACSRQQVLPWAAPCRNPRARCQASSPLVRPFPSRARRHVVSPARQCAAAVVLQGRPGGGGTRAMRRRRQHFASSTWCVCDSRAVLGKAARRLLDWPCSKPHCAPLR